MTNQATPLGNGVDGDEALDLAGKHIVLGLSGGIACYKAAELCRALIKAGATVQVVMTEAAEQFITPVTCRP
jgi:phosphopantothenoylcysteine decarboxylase/phosphopantothenate--cysteine ligase